MHNLTGKHHTVARANEPKLAGVNLEVAVKGNTEAITMKGHAVNQEKNYVIDGDDVHWTDDENKASSKGRVSKPAYTDPYETSPLMEQQLVQSTRGLPAC